MPVPEPDEKPKKGIVTSNQKAKRKELQYDTEDIKAIEEWVKRHVESTWHSLGVSYLPPVPPFILCKKC